MVLNTQIPKIIHQLWIGQKPAPTKFMETWRKKHEPHGFKYMFWNEKNISQNINLAPLLEKLNSIEEINGKADVIRWLILQKFGGVFVDADSICIHAFDEHILNNVDAFAGWEQEHIREGLAATGTMGFTPYHPIVNSAIEWIKHNPISTRLTRQRAWFTVGPGLLTRICQLYDWKNIKIYPSHYFLPFHYSGIRYTGHEKVYAYQEWGSTKKNYEVMNNIELPIELNDNNVRDSVSVLMSTLNSKAEHLKQCLESIKNQQCNLNIQVVIVNDGSDKFHTEILKNMIRWFLNTSRFCTVKLIENDKNMGLGYSLNRGVNACDNEIIMRMDTDDIMINNRIQKQFDFIKNNSDCVLCGAQVAMFKVDNIKNIVMQTNHSNISWNDYKNNIDMQNKHWLLNHPTFCFKRSKIIEAGNYNSTIHSMVEDFDLTLRVLKTYGKIYNMPDVLLYYRLHPGQVTHSGSDPKWKHIRNEIISNMLVD